MILFEGRFIKAPRCVSENRATASQRQSITETLCSLCSAKCKSTSRKTSCPPVGKTNLNIFKYQLRRKKYSVLESET